MKREASFQTIFNNYLREKKMDGVFELKQTRTDSIPFLALETHQRESLLAVEDNGFVWKLSDADPRQKPFDCFSIGICPAYVVIRYPECFVMIRIDEFLQEERISERKSLTLQKAKDIAERICTL